MSIWQHAQWRSQPTRQQQYTELCLHMDEVEEASSADVSSAQHSRSSGSLEAKLTRLQREKEAFEQELGIGGPRRFVARTDARGGRH